MHSTEQVSVIAILVIYLSGLVVGLFGCTVYASVLENANMSLLARSPDPICAGVRIMLGVFTRDDGYLRSLSTGGQATRKPHGRGRVQ
jgi:hypothetical protein